MWALDGSAGRQLAYKVFHGSELGDSVKARRFRNGYFSMASLQHPRIVAVRELTEAPLGFSMDLVNGADLRDAYIDRSDASAVLSTAIDIADTIRFAHGAGVIHRDVKPENVIMEWNIDQGVYVPKLTDFDLAYIETNRTVTINMVGGVVNYAAPEQFYASGGAAARAVTVDVYAFGQLLFFLFVGSDPAADRREANYERFSHAVGGVLAYEPAEIVIDLYKRSTQSAPESRPQQMEEVVAGLTRARIVQEAQSRTSVFDSEEVARQVAYAYAGPGGFSTASGGASFQSRSGTLAVEIKSRGVPSADQGDFVFNISASQAFGVPGAGSGAHARRILNQRLDRRLQRFAEVSRVPGDSGYFQTHIRVDAVSLTVGGASRLAEILSTAVSAIEQLD